MKYKLLLIFFFLLSANTIYSQKRQNKMTNNNKIEQSLITPDFEKFDSIRFEQLKKRKDDIDVYGSLNDKRNIILSDYGSSKGYSETIPNSYFFISKGYYSNNNIAAKGLGFIYHGFKVGIWYYFDENGKLKETVDHDKPFKFTLEHIFKFCEREKIPVKKEWDNDVDGFYRTGINRVYDPEKGECYWTIQWFNYEKTKVEEIHLDGVTGKEISRTYMDYIR